MLSERQLRRYKRNIQLEGVGEEGQEKLLNARVLVVGAGGLGSPVLYYLAAAGVGTLGIIDDDRVDYSNLQRQVIHNTNDVEKLKVESAVEKIQKLNPGILINKYPDKLNEQNYKGIINKYHAVVDGTDNFKTRFLINEACVYYDIPYIFGGVLGFNGQAMTIIPGQTPCLRCVFPEIPGEAQSPSGEEGILGAVPGVMGSILATETVKYLLGLGELLTGRLLNYDALSMQFIHIETSKNPECIICNKK